VTASWDGVLARRLERSSLAPRAPLGRIVDVVRGLGGVQAQVQASAELQLAARVDALRREDVTAALWERRELVRAWTIRGTLHLHAADELALWLAARRAVAGTVGDVPEWRDPEGVLHPPLPAAEAEAVREAVWDVLDGRSLRRDELAHAVVERVGPRPRARLLSGFAFFLGDLCQGPPQGARITLVRPDQWVAGWREVDPDDALREVCRRFLRAHGPARPADFQEWFGTRAFGVAAARTLFASLDLHEVDVAGRTAFVLRGDARFARLTPSVRLVPEYDAYVMGFRERDVLVPDSVRALVATHRRGRYEGPAGVRFVLVDGVAAGLWERAKRGRRLELTVALVGAPGRSRKAALADEAERLARFHGLEPSLEVTKRA
jgi:Winged helix DNA-binding domain